MPQDDYLFERLTKESERAKINQVLAAIVTNNSGDAEPTTTYPFQFWADTTNDLLKLRNEANDAWITFGSLTSTLLTASGLTINSGKIAGRSSASAGALEELSLSQVLDLIGSAAQGDILYRGASAWARLAAGTDGYSLVTQGADANPKWSSVSPAGYLFGLTLSNNASDATNDIDIATGKCRDSTDVDTMVLASALTKRLDAAWAVGTNQGGLDTGSIANATYHVWLIKRSDTGVVDALFSTSATAPTMPANYDYKRRIGSIVRASATIVPFVQDHIRFMRKTPVTDVSAAGVSNATAVTRTLSIPTGIRVGAINTLTLTAPTSGAAATSYYVLSDLSRTDTAAGTGNAHVAATWDGTAFGVAGSSGFVETMTNTSAQIRSKGFSINYSGVTITIGTHGWVDYRLLSGS